MNGCPCFQDLVEFPCSDMVYPMCYSAGWNCWGVTHGMTILTDWISVISNDFYWISALYTANLLVFSI